MVGLPELGHSIDMGGRTSDVLVSFHSRDRETVFWLADLLRDHGLELWLYEWEQGQKQGQSHRVEDTIVTVDAITICIGAGGLGPWLQPRQLALLTKAKLRNTAVVLVLLPGGSEADLHTFLEECMWADCRAGFTGAVMARIVAGLRQQLPSVAVVPPSRPLPLGKPRPPLSVRGVGSAGAGLA